MSFSNLSDRIRKGNRCYGSPTFRLSERLGFSFCFRPVSLELQGWHRQGKSQGNLKSQGKVREFLLNSESQGILCKSQGIFTRIYFQVKLWKLILYYIFDIKKHLSGVFENMAVIIVIVTLFVLYSTILLFARQLGRPC